MEMGLEQQKIIMWTTSTITSCKLNVITSTPLPSVLIYVTCPDVGLFFIAKVRQPCLRVTVGKKSAFILVRE